MSDDCQCAYMYHNVYSNFVIAHTYFRWKIVIHGGVDGYSHLIVFLRAANNNRSSTVMDSFLTAVHCCPRELELTTEERTVQLA